MKVFITGGTGFVGREILRQLIEAGHEVRCLVRPGSESKITEFQGVETRNGDATCPETLVEALSDCDAAIHLIGIIREFPSKGITFSRMHFETARNVVAAAEAQGVKRYLHMSANGTCAGASSDYHKTKWQGEEAVRLSGLSWTIFRPSLIFGAEGELVKTLVSLIRKMPIVPVVGTGKYLMSPVAVEDVAASFVKALVDEKTIGQTYHCCGPEELSYDEILDIIGQSMGKKKVDKLHQPLSLVKPIVSLMESVPGFPITSTQLELLIGGNICDPKPWAEAFGLKPQAFKEKIGSCLQMIDANSAPNRPSHQP